jgi:thymidylate synthase (FAD)
MEIKTYLDQRVKCLRATEDPGRVVQLALEITQKKITGQWTKEVSGKTLKYLLDANHTSVLEHASITFLISNVSRSFLAQITRHRIASYTASSQHYQDYRDYPVVISPDFATGSEKDYMMKNRLEWSIGEYAEMVEYGVPVWEARQILPNATACIILWTINARSLINFLNLRLCRRNVPEMHIFAQNVHRVCSSWWPELFNWIGADCAMKGKCTQGRMSCGNPYSPIIG